MDIIDRIRQKAPSEIDIMHQNIERRKALTDDKVNQILQDVFTKIDVDRLSPALSYRWHDIKNRM
jgi:hypothetical protein